MNHQLCTGVYQTEIFLYNKWVLGLLVALKNGGYSEHFMIRRVRTLLQAKIPVRKSKR